MTRRAGFTLLEVLAVILLTSIVIAVALNHYIDLTRASQRASEHARSVRRAAAVLDRVARDLEMTVLVAKEPEQDPWQHPWIFVGEARHSELGSDHLKFVTRGRQPRATAGHESDLEVVAYAWARRSDEEGFELRRWSSPMLPEVQDREIPDEESEGAVLLADDLVDFGVTFGDETGVRTATWDSTQLVESSELPMTAEITVAMHVPRAPPDAEPLLFRRHVMLPVRPLNLTELLDPQALVSGGPGVETADTGDGSETGDVDETGNPLDPTCQATPCAHMTACQAIDCAAELANSRSPSFTLMLNDTIARNLSFCRWRQIHAPQIWWMIDNPACRVR